MKKYVNRLKKDGTMKRKARIKRKKMKERREEYMASVGIRNEAVRRGTTGRLTQSSIETPPPPPPHLINSLQDTGIFHPPPAFCLTFVYDDALFALSLLTIVALVPHLLSALERVIRPGPVHFLFLIISISSTSAGR